MIKPSITKAHLKNIISEISKNPNDFVKNPGHDMTRNRKCNLFDTVSFILSMSGQSLNTEMLKYFGPKKKTMPSKASFLQQRRKLSDSLFPYIFNKFNEQIPFTKCYKGYHLVAIDGTDVNMVKKSDDTAYAVKQARSDNYYYQMHINSLYDILEKRFLDLVIQPRPEAHERVAAIQMIERNQIKGKSIYICDRGYASYNFAAVIDKLGQYFLVRYPLKLTKSFNKFKAFPNEPEFCINYSVELTRSKKAFKTNPNEAMQLRVASDRPLDVVTDKSDSYILKLRLVKLTLETPSGESTEEYIATNLPEDVFSISEIKKLYNMRWKIETSFKSLKYACGLIVFHSRSRQYNVQEVYARFIMYNLTALIDAYTDYILQKRKRKKEFNTSFADSVPIVRLFLNDKITCKEVEELLLSYIIKVRPGRSEPRKIQSQRAVSLTNRP